MYNTYGMTMGRRTTPSDDSVDAVNDTIECDDIGGDDSGASGHRLH